MCEYIFKIAHGRVENFRFEIAQDNLKMITDNNNDLKKKLLPVIDREVMALGIL